MTILNTCAGCGAGKTDEGWTIPDNLVPPETEADLEEYCPVCVEKTRKAIVPISVKH